MRRFDDEAASLVRADSVVVRVTMSPIFAFTFMVAIIRDLRLAHPDLRIDVDTSEAFRDLANGEADIALRVSTAPVGAGLICRRLTDTPWAVYCSRAYADEHGAPRHIDDLANAPLIGGGEPEVWPHYQEWLAEHHLEGQVVMHHNSSAGLLAAVRGGMGLAVLPCLVADSDPDLMRCLPPISGRIGLWLIYPERYRAEPRIRKVLDFIAPRIPRHTAL
jgi:DNA-binding transcriptional LysR family regulator